MSKIVVNGPARLKGSIQVSGSKNAALPIIFSCILLDGVSEIDGLPDIGDVKVALKILSDFGAKITSNGKTTCIDTTNLTYNTPDLSLIGKIRASTYLIGACLSRFGRCEILPYGGCNFSSRPIDMHLYACESLGAIKDDRVITASFLNGGVITFDKKSVGATVNAILLTVSAKGDSIIKGVAVEPHIDALIDFLVSAGASINRKGDCIFVHGSNLHGGKTTVIGDMIEAGTYLAAGVMTGGKVTLEDCPINQMSAVFSSLREVGAEILIDNNSVTATATERRFPISVVASPYPGFPTDLQPIFAPLMAAMSGGEIVDTVWQDRFGYLNALARFGVCYKLNDFKASVGKSKFISSTVSAPDLRGGMACLLCAVMAKGKSEIFSAETILRGYESLIAKMSALGADIYMTEK